MIPDWGVRVWFPGMTRAIIQSAPDKGTAEALRAQAKAEWPEATAEVIHTH